EAKALVGIISTLQGTKEKGKCHSLDNWFDQFLESSISDQRLEGISRFLELKIFKTGLGDLSLFIVLEYRHMMKVIPFILKGLFEQKKNELLVQIFVE
ncbi:12800_t:CDS:2, partial [Dentiscutata erythropus]